VDLDEYVEKIVAHEEKVKNPKNWKFKVRKGMRIEIRLK